MANTTASTANASFTNALTQNTKSNTPQASQSILPSTDSTPNLKINDVTLPSNIASILALATTTTTNTANTSSAKFSEKVPEVTTPAVPATEISLFLSKLTNATKESQPNLTLESIQEKTQEISKSELITKALAPLSIPSNPIVYPNDVKDIETPKKEDLKMDINNNSISAQENNKNNDTSRLDEKAKLESILQNTMLNQSSSVHHSSKTMNSHSLMSLNNKPTKVSGMEIGVTSSFAPVVNVPTNNGNWTSRPMNRIPPPNYVCTICKIPGHYKSFCPEAVSQNKCSVLSNMRSSDEYIVDCLFDNFYNKFFLS